MVGETPDTANTLNWTLLAAKGEKGDKSDKGDKGDKGPPGSISYVQASQAGGSQGLPDDGAFRDVVEVTLGGGAWLVVAKAVLNDGSDDRNNANQYVNGDGCQLTRGTATYVDSAAVTLGDSNNGRGPVDFPLAMTGIVIGPTTLKIQCRAQDDADQVGVSQGRIVAIRIGD